MYRITENQINIMNNGGLEKVMELEVRWVQGLGFQHPGAENCNLASHYAVIHPRRDPDQFISMKC